MQFYKFVRSITENTVHIENHFVTVVYPARLIIRVCGLRLGTPEIWHWCFAFVILGCSQNVDFVHLHCLRKLGKHLLNDSNMPCFRFLLCCTIARLILLCRKSSKQMNVKAITKATWRAFHTFNIHKNEHGKFEWHNCKSICLSICYEEARTYKGCYSLQTKEIQ